MNFSPGWLPVAGMALLAACGAPSGTSNAKTAYDEQAPAEVASVDEPAAAMTDSTVSFIQADDPGYPLLPEQGADANAFVPAGWMLEKSLEGDLNIDGRPDLAMLMREADPDKMLPASHDGGERGFNTNPYRIAVAFLEADGRTYRLAMENHTLIPRHTNRSLDDPFQDFTLNRGSLIVHLSHFANMGGWGMATIEYQFRYQQAGFRLIGYDRIDTQRNTGEVETISANYLTGKVKHGKGSIDSDEEAIRWSKLTELPLLQIDQVGDGMDFDPVTRRQRAEEGR